MKWNRICTAALALSFGLSAAAAAAEPSTAQQKLEDLDFLCKTLEETHPDLYANVSREEFSKRRQEIAAKAAGLDDFTFGIELECLTALIGDSHTQVAFGGSSAMADVRMIPVDIQDFEGRWILSALEKKNERFLGMELTAIQGVPVEEVYQRMLPFINHDNDVRARRGFRQNVYVASLLEYFGIIEGDGPVTLTARDRDGKEYAFSADQTLDMSKLEVASLSDRRASAPKTERVRGKNYWFAPVNPKTLYIQYNACVEDKSYPMEQFVRDLESQLKKGYYSKVLVDLRYNGGGSDGLFVPAIEKLKLYADKTGYDIYTLIGDTTFSSAATTAIWLKEIAGSQLVGGPTGGSANHFGSVASFQLPNTGLALGCSTKYIDIDAFLGQNPEVFGKERSRVYGKDAIQPDIPVSQTLDDYLNGIDTAVRTIIDLTEFR